MDTPQNENISSTEMSAMEAALQRIEIGHVYPRHIKLSVDLRDLRIEDRSDVFEEVKSIFPGMTEFAESRARSYLIFGVKTLPQARLPLTIGGLPFTIGDEAGNGRGMLMRPTPPGNMHIRLCSDIKGSQVSFQTNGFREFADRVNKDVQELALEFQVIEFILRSDRLMYLVLPDEVDINSVRSKIPGRIASCWTMPLNERDVNRPSQKAQRVTLPSSAYSTTNKNVSDDTVFLDNPLTGTLEGTILARSWRPVSNSQAFVIFDWVYLGQGHGEDLKIPDSVCGSPVRDSNGLPVGFFQFYVETGQFEGFYAAVRADGVARDGCELVL